jgi:hypothetical protein
MRAAFALLPLANPEFAVLCALEPVADLVELGSRSCGDFVLLLVRSEDALITLAEPRWRYAYGARAVRSIDQAISARHDPGRVGVLIEQRPKLPGDGG